MNELRCEAIRNDVSLNYLVNQVLKGYTSWGRYETLTGMMPVPKTILSFVIDRILALDNNAGVKDACLFRKMILRRAAEIAFEDLMDLAMGLKAKVDLQIMLDVLQYYLEQCDIPCVSETVGNTLRFIVRHNLGMSWSLFLAELINLIFQRFSEEKVEPKIMPNILLIELPLRYVGRQQPDDFSSA